ncbi:EH domain-binding protein 1-like [Pocillopora verrucosa]|uniref:EH domain-binding protein 1-like n=1 Tax=Pocillopora verrucosa TaxID=203993 RepID=UPI00333F811A
MVKLELQMKEAIDTEDCEAEFESLSLDWLALNKFRSELDERKPDLLTLSRQENRKECLKFLRQDLKCLFEVKGWKKTEEHKDQEKNVLDLILNLTNMA